MTLTNRQTELLRLANQLSQSLISGSGLSSNNSLDLPGLDVDVDLDVDLGGDDTVDPVPGTPTPPTTPTTPTTLREVLLTLVNEQVEVTTPFGVVTGTLLVVESDYVVIVESSGAQVLVRIEKIELVSEM
ncbi:DUF2642 domain-containing protein [Halobacillus amylolyticus]|uniref:DUF2642 domain-containing protein n=1 Tax=Halobacillus amylolyticus TaxID=2932259 RepID=A0ABY4HAS1_9BACI|nr:DUF2642 domain-containing protein [Halobacillus amylolyticus]UOR11547.1 DUF2642 domain-containing protein [Halobacillus amylolyticus]